MIYRYYIRGNQFCKEPQILTKSTRGPAQGKKPRNPCGATVSRLIYSSYIYNFDTPTYTISRGVHIQFRDPTYTKTIPLRIQKRYPPHIYIFETYIYKNETPYTGLRLYIYKNETPLVKLSQAIFYHDLPSFGWAWFWTRDRLVQNWQAIQSMLCKDCWFSLKTHQKFIRNLSEQFWNMCGTMSKKQAHIYNFEGSGHGCRWVSIILKNPCIMRVVKRLTVSRSMPNIYNFEGSQNCICSSLSNGASQNCIGTAVRHKILRTERRFYRTARYSFKF